MGTLLLPWEAQLDHHLHEEVVNIQSKPPLVQPETSRHHFSSEKRDQHSPHSNIPSSTYREMRSSLFLSRLNKVSFLRHPSYVFHSSPFTSFSAHSQITQYTPCSKQPKTERISRVLPTKRQSLSWLSLPTLFLM